MNTNIEFSVYTQIIYYDICNIFKHYQEYLTEDQKKLKSKIDEYFMSDSYLNQNEIIKLSCEFQKTVHAIWNDKITDFNEIGIKKNYQLLLNKQNPKKKIKDYQNVSLFKSTDLDYYKPGLYLSFEYNDTMRFNNCFQPMYTSLTTPDKIKRNEKVFLEKANLNGIIVITKQDEISDEDTEKFIQKHNRIQVKTLIKK